MNRPTVSVVIPTYNRAALLPRALESVIAQTFLDWEIVLVDDGSTDETESVAADYANRLGSRFIHLRQDNAGSSAARNRGIDAARGEFIAFLDSDDEYLPRKLERQIRLFELCPELGLVYSDYAFIDSDGVRHESVFDTKGRLAREVPCTTVGSNLRVCDGTLFDTLIRGYFIATIVGMVRRSVLGETIRFPADLSYAEEWLFYLTVSRACRAGFVDEPLCLHHYVDGSLSRTDKHRNMQRYRDVLHRIRTAFGDLDGRQRAAVDDNLAGACRQLGFNTYHRGYYRRAARYFAESLRYRRSLAVAWDTGHAVIRWLLGGAPRHDRPLPAPRAASAS